MSEFPQTITRTLKEDGDDFLNLALRKWKFNSKFSRNIKLFIALGLFFLIFGVVFLVYSMKIVDFSQQYDDICQDKFPGECIVEFNITKNMEQPIYFYYLIDNFYQTHRKFYLSKDTLQLRGEQRDLDDLDSCYPFVTNQQMEKQFSINNNTLDPNARAIPCGLIAKTFFNGNNTMFNIVNSNFYLHKTDTYTLVNKSNNQIININQNNIAWDVDIQYNYKNQQNYLQNAWIDVTNEHFMVWMRTSGMGRIKKLWGRIYDDLPIGQYYLKIQNVYDIRPFNGKKTFTITTTTAMGQKNSVLIAAYFAGAFVCLVAIIVLFYLRYKDNKNKIN